MLKWKAQFSQIPVFVTAPRDVILMFKELNKSGSGSLSLEEFHSVYDAAMLKWEAQFSQIPVFVTSPCGVILMFKELNKSGSGSLLLEEFYSVYDAAMLKWEAQFSQIPWFHTTWAPLQTFCQLTHDFVTWKYFEHIVCKHLLNFASMRNAQWLWSPAI